MNLPLIIFTVLILFSCNNIDDPSIISVHREDQEMNAAIKKAKATLHLFFKNYKTMENVGYSLKFGLKTSGGDIEHIWFNPLEVDGDTIIAECVNDPEDIFDLKLGDVRELKRDQITDWMIVSGNKCYGGYTIRVLSDRNPKNAPSFQYVDF